MFKRAFAIITVMMLTLGSTLAIADTAPTKDQVIAQVAKAVEYYKTNGRERALAAFNSKDGPFASGMDYVDVHDLNGVCVAHPLSRDVVGVNRLTVADMHGKKFIAEMVDAAKSQTSGWINYMRENPNTGKIEHKIAYWQIHDGLIFKAGTYE
jgi:cytochrome c